MATINSFTDITAWQKARCLSIQIFELTCSGTFSKDFSLKDQINRATGSVMDNITEGFERESKNEFVNFLTYSKGSAGETLSQLYRARDRNHISQQEFEKLTTEVKEVCRLIAGFINYLNSTTIRGLKFKNRS